MEEVNHFSMKKLSTQQKAILELICKESSIEFVSSTYISREIAHRFNREDDNRILFSEKKIAKAREKFEEDVKLRKLSKEQIKSEYMILSPMWEFAEQMHRRKEILTQSHRASFSRSLKRLWYRGLIDCIGSYKFNRDKNVMEIVYTLRTNYVFLTDKGKKVCEILGFLSLETKIIDIHKRNGKKPYFDIYIGRRQPFTEFTKNSKWANPYLMDKIKNGKIIKKRDGTAKEVVEKYRKYLLNNKELMNDLPELKGKILGCWCKNQEWYKEGLCHGDILIELL